MFFTHHNEPVRLLVKAKLKTVSVCLLLYFFVFNGKRSQREKNSAVRKILLKTAHAAWVVRAWL